jgi:predicted nucleic acid-binding protein
MSLYVDSSALLKLYFDEPDSALAEALLTADPTWVTARHTFVEVRRSLARALGGRELGLARDQFDADWASTNVVEITEEVCRLAGEIAEVTGARTLDALHLAAARVAGGGALAMATFDLRQAQVARSLGCTVLGA